MLDNTTDGESLQGAAAQLNESRNRIWGDFGLEQLREFTASWGSREHHPEPFGPLVESPDRCLGCGSPIAFVYYHRKYVAVDVVKRYGYPYSDFPGWPIADLLSTHACPE